MTLGRRGASGRPRLFPLTAAALLLTGCLGHPSHADPAPQFPGFTAALLRPGPWTRVVVEIDYVASRPPEQDALDWFRKNLQDQAPGHAIDVLPLTVIPPLPEPFTATDAARYAQRNYDHVRGERGLDGDLAIHIMYLNGGPSDDIALGWAAVSEIVLFAERMDKSAFPGASALPVAPHSVAMERTVLVHELGHIFGLVGCGVKMVRLHNDPEHPCHSSSTQSVMWWQTEVRSVIDLSDGNPRLLAPASEFDAMDLEDLKAFRESDDRGR